MNKISIAVALGLAIALVAMTGLSERREAAKDHP